MPLLCPQGLDIDFRTVKPLKPCRFQRHLFMSKHDKIIIVESNKSEYNERTEGMSTYEDVLNGRRDHGIRFADLCKLVRDLGFTERIQSGHHVFTTPGLPLINLQEDGAKAKAYQVAQVRRIIKDYNLEVRK